MMIQYKTYQVKPVYVKASKFKKSEASGLCFSKLPNWARYTRSSTSEDYVYSGELSDEEFESLRREYKVNKKDLKTYIFDGENYIIAKHGQWVVKHSDGKIEILDQENFKNKYVEV